jgi:hypothetical protein
MKKHIPMHIFVETFTENIYVSYGVSREVFIESVKEQLNIDQEVAKGINGKCVVFDKPITWIWTDKKKVSILAHEVFHAVFYMLGSRGIILNNDTDEIFAYSIQSILRQILKKG